MYATVTEGRNGTLIPLGRCRSARGGMLFRTVFRGLNVHALTVVTGGIYARIRMPGAAIVRSIRSRSGY